MVCALGESFASRGEFILPLTKNTPIAIAGHPAQAWPRAIYRLGDHGSTEAATARMVLPVRIELTTSPLPRGCSTTELRQLGVRGRGTEIQQPPPLGKAGALD